MVQRLLGRRSYGQGGAGAGGRARLQELLQGNFCRGQATHRFVERLTVEEIEEAGEKLIAVDITGNAFLHNMVRTIVGTLVEIGRGHRPVEWIDEVLAAQNRIAAGSCAPAQGLTFVSVRYPEGVLQPW